MLRAIRLIKSDKKYGIEFIKGPWLDLGKDRERIAARVYDAAAPDLPRSRCFGRSDSSKAIKNMASSSSRAPGSISAKIASESPPGFTMPPRRICRDLDASGDPTHQKR